MNPTTFIEHLRTFEKSDAVDALGQNILQELRTRGQEIEMVQCTIIDKATNRLRIWIFSTNDTEPIEQMVAAMKKPKSAACYTLTDTSQEIIIETDATEKKAYLFLFVLLFHLGHITSEVYLSELKARNIVY